MADSDGLCIAGFLSGSYCEDQSSLSLAFNTPVRLISYLTGYNSLDGASATVSFTQNSNTSTQASFPKGIVTPFNNQFTAAAGVPIVTSRTSNATIGSSIQFTQLTVEQVSSTVPGPLPLAGAAIALSWSRKLRHASPAADRRRSIAGPILALRAAPPGGSARRGAPPPGAGAVRGPRGPGAQRG